MTKEPPSDCTPPRWQDPDHQRRYLNAPVPDSSKPDCTCGRPKHLIFNKTTDRYSEARACEVCDLLPEETQ